MEERQAKILINKAGGNASALAKNYRVALPSVWMNALGIDEDHREVTLQFDGEAITIRLQAPDGYAAFLQNARQIRHDLLVLNFYDGDSLTTKICADQTAHTLAIQNHSEDPLRTAFGVKQAPTWQEFEEFLESRCIPRHRDGIARYLDELQLDRYDPLSIIRKTEGRMAEDHHWIKIVEG